MRGDWPGSGKSVASIALRAGLGLAAIVAAVALIVVVVKWAPQWLASTRGLSASDRAADYGRIRTGLLAVLAGAVAVVGAVYTARTFALNRSGQITDRFTHAIEQIGSDKPEIKLGGIYALERIVSDSREDYAAIVDILEVYVRRRRPASYMRERVGSPADVSSEDLDKELPDADVQAALTVLGRSSTTNKAAFEAWMREGGRLEFDFTDLRRVSLQGADLRGAVFASSDLRNAFLSSANLRNTHFTGSDLRKVNLSFADLRNADFFEADLCGAALPSADLRGANLAGARHLDYSQLVPALMDKTTLLPEAFEGVRRPPPDVLPQSERQMVKRVRTLLRRRSGRKRLHKHPYVTAVYPLPLRDRQMFTIVGEGLGIDPGLPTANAPQIIIDGIPAEFIEDSYGTALVAEAPPVISAGGTPIVRLLQVLNPYGAITPSFPVACQ